MLRCPDFGLLAANFASRVLKRQVSIIFKKSSMSPVMSMPTYLELSSIDELAALVALISACILHKEKRPNSFKTEQSYNSNLHRRHIKDKSLPQICLPRTCEGVRDSYVLHYRPACWTERNRQTCHNGCNKAG